MIDSREPVKLILVTDELFDHLKAKDEVARGKKGVTVVESSDEGSDLEDIVNTKESVELDMKNLDHKYSLAKKKTVGLVDIEATMA